MKKKIAFILFVLFFINTKLISPIVFSLLSKKSITVKLSDDQPSGSLYYLNTKLKLNINEGITYKAVLKITDLKGAVKEDLSFVSPDPKLLSPSCR